MRKVRQAAVTLVSASPDGGDDKLFQTLKKIASGEPLAQINPDHLWCLYDWLDSAVDAAYHLYPKVHDTLREIGYMPAD